MSELDQLRFMSKWLAEIKKNCEILSYEDPNPVQVAFGLLLVEVSRAIRVIEGRQGP